MHSAPPLQLRVNRYELWRAMVLLLATGACAATLAWWRAQPVPAPRWAGATAAIGTLASLASLVGLWRMRALTLRWDRQCWLVTRDGAAEQAGELSVAIDLGGWILLRFVPAGAGPGPARHGVAGRYGSRCSGAASKRTGMRCVARCIRRDRPCDLTLEVELE
jgi:hypothetical protein